MAQINNATLTFSTPFTEGGQRKVNIQVKYDAVFNASERNDPDLRFLETIEIVGVDLVFGGEIEEILIEKVLPTQEIPVTPGQGSETVERTRTFKALRSLLQEDPAPGNADEIRCNIQIAYVVANATAASASANAVLAG